MNKFNVGLIVGCILLVGFLIYMNTDIDCKQTSYILKGVNGITEENSGLLSSGDVSKTSLLMDDGTIITLNHRVDKLKLNQPITIKECRNRFGAKSYYIVWS